MKLNPIDKVLAYFNPVGGIKRAHARSILAYYEAARPTRKNKNRRETGSGNDAVLRAGATLRQQARHLEQNYDLALGVLNTLVANTVGPNGIGVEPQPRNEDGTINDALAREIMDLWKDWCREPEVTKQHDWASTCRMIARSWYRDGEEFTQMVSGNIPSLNHGTRVPFSVEMLEADYVPLDYQAAAPAVIMQGIEVNAWGAPLAYHVYKQDPLQQSSIFAGSHMKRVPATRMLHIKNVHRIRQMRGVSVFASVLNRFDDLKDYEESERIAAKIAASMAAFIKKGAPDQYQLPEFGDPDHKDGARSMKLQPGMVFDDLKPGEEIGMIDTNRPNPNLETYRSGQLKAIGAGTGPTFSSIARTYDGTYSAQRQELVEGYMIYGTLSNEFIGRIVRPIYEQFIAVALASGQIKLPAGVKPESVDDASYMAPAMPWIDPKKEAEAWAIQEDRSYVSAPEIIRKRGGNPIETLEQQSSWLAAKKKADVPTPGAPALAAPANEEELEQQRAEAGFRRREAEARAKLWEVRTAQEEVLAEAVLGLRTAERKEHEARRALHDAQQSEVLARANQAEQEAKLASAQTDLAEVEHKLAMERAQADATHASDEHKLRMDILEMQVQFAQTAEAERKADADKARGHAEEIQREVVATARARTDIARADLAAAQEALAEIRGET